jgi:hypothetical protein
MEWLDNNDISTEPHDWSEWKNLYSMASVTSTEFLRIRNLLGNENKKEYRRIHGGWMLKIQNEADAGRIGKAIQAIVDRSPSFLMESLRQEDSTVTDGHKIHTLITAFFATWFSRLPEEKERDRRLAECVLSQDKHKWDSLMTSIGIPEQASQRLWNAYKPKDITPEGLHDASLISSYVPTFEEYIKYVATLDNKSAPGNSGLSYLMVKLWPQEIQERAYQCLCEAWSKKEGIEGWSTRLLAPIPKKPNPTIDDLRPLMLVEVMRKIWVGLLMGRIRKFWSKHNLIDESQHANLRGKGTETAIPQLINAMEAAKEFSTDIYLSSWDMSKAFDNLSWEMIHLALRRLHVPEDIAAYLISLDAGGRVMVRTPWLLEKLRSADKELEGSDYFITEKGVGQGDIPTPLL